MVRRFFRIAPLYYLVLLIVYVFKVSTPGLQAETGFVGGVEGGFHPPEFGAGFLFQHLSFLFGFFPSFVGDNIIPDWSLALEMQFYACFPFLALLMDRVGSAAFFFVCCLVSAVANQLITFYAGSPPGLLGWYSQPSILPLKIHVFAVGIVAARVYFNGFRELRSWWYIPGFILFCLTCKFNYTRVLGVFYWMLYLLAITPRLAPCLSSTVARLNLWCEIKGWFRWPAELSYSGYLIHGIVMVLIFGWPTLHASNRSISSFKFTMIYLLMLVLISALGVLLHHLIEKPGIRFGKFLLGRMSRP